MEPCGGDIMVQKMPSSENTATASDRKPRREKSTLISHNVMVDGRRTSVRLEKEMWMAFKDIAKNEKCTIHELCTAVAQRKKPDTSLTAAIRVFIMAYFQAAATQEGIVMQAITKALMWPKMFCYVMLQRLITDCANSRLCKPLNFITIYMYWAKYA